VFQSEVQRQPHGDGRQEQGQAGIRTIARHAPCGQSQNSQRRGQRRQAVREVHRLSAVGQPVDSAEIGGKQKEPHTHIAETANVEAAWGIAIDQLPAALEQRTQQIAGGGEQKYFEEQGLLASGTQYHAKTD